MSFNPCDTKQPQVLIFSPEPKKDLFTRPKGGKLWGESPSPSSSDGSACWDARTQTAHGATERQLNRKERRSAEPPPRPPPTLHKRSTSALVYISLRVRFFVRSKSKPRVLETDGMNRTENAGSQTGRERSGLPPSDEADERRKQPPGRHTEPGDDSSTVQSRKPPRSALTCTFTCRLTL